MSLVIQTKIILVVMSWTPPMMMIPFSGDYKQPRKPEYALCSWVFALCSHPYWTRSALCIYPSQF
jgi:hypothetical protein